MDIGGSGKTYLINEYKEKSDKKNSIVYVSLNGVTDLEKTFKQATINISNTTTENAKKIGFGIFKSVINNKFGIEIDDLNLPVIPITTIYKACDKEIIFIDDIERCKCEIGEVFGIIDELLRNDFKIILIMNSEPFGNNDKFKEIQEKIINRQLFIKPDNDTFKDIINNMCKTIPEADFLIFDRAIKDNYKNWFYVFDDELSETKYKPNLRLFTRTIDNSLEIIKDLNSYIDQSDKEQIYNEILNNVYLHLHKDTFPDEIDDKKCKEYLDNLFGLCKGGTKDEKYLECEKYYHEAGKSSLKRIKILLCLSCVKDYFSINEMPNKEQYKIEFKSIEDIPAELESFKSGNLCEADYLERSESIIKNLYKYKPTLILRIIDKLLETDYYLNTNYLSKNKKQIKNFISKNKIVIINLDPSDFLPFQKSNKKLDEEKQELLDYIETNNTKIYFNKFKEYLDNFTRIDKEETIVINEKVFQNIMKMSHKNIIKTAIEKMKYNDYISIMDWVFRNKSNDELKTTSLTEYKNELLKSKISKDKVIQKNFEIWLNSII